MRRHVVCVIFSVSTLFGLLGCAESTHQQQRLTQLSQSGEYGSAALYDGRGPYYYNPGFWWSPFVYYPGYYGYGPGYRSGYAGPPSRSGTSTARQALPSNAPPQFFKRKD